jgi:2-methylisocitrate lyase-like PEP mutase family enzyme
VLNNAGARLRELIGGEGLVWGPGVYDGISARVATAAGFSMLYMTGSGTSASRVGHPDLGVATLNEMVENARTIASVATVPVVADADTGFGGPVNVARTVHLYEQAGVAAIHIEDQTFPKRCGHLAGKAVVSTEEFVQRIRAATRERYDPSFVIIARTDARAVNGFDDAVDRIARAFDAGADAGFLEAPQSLEEVEQSVTRCPGPMLMNVTSNGRTPTLRVPQVAAMGFKLAIFPGALTRAAMLAMRRACATLVETGTDEGILEGMGPRDFFSVMGIDEAMAIDARAGGQSLAKA